MRRQKGVSDQQFQQSISLMLYSHCLLNSSKSLNILWKYHNYLSSVLCCSILRLPYLFWLDWLDHELELSHKKCGKQCEITFIITKCTSCQVSIFAVVETSCQLTLTTKMQKVNNLSTTLCNTDFTGFHSHQILHLMISCSSLLVTNVTNGILLTVAGVHVVKPGKKDVPPKEQLMSAGVCWID